MLNSCPRYMRESEWLASLNKRRANKKTILKAAVILLLIAAPFAAAALISMLSNGNLEVARYTVDSPEIGGSVRIVMISDLHRKKLDPTNQQVVDKTALEQPDLIAVNGDMIERDCTEEEAEAFRSLLERLCAIAPVYFSVGNHDLPALYSEFELGENYEMVRGIEPTGLVRLFESTGAKMLERNYEDIEVNGARIRIGGLYAFAYPNRYYTAGQYLPIFEWLKEFCDTDRYTLLLSHRPKSFTISDLPYRWDIDLVLSGHTHNGVAALPFGLGAVYASEAFFQRYGKGHFKVNGTDLVICAGIDGYKGVIPRVFNPPEIVTIDILPDRP